MNKLILAVLLMIQPLMAFAGQPLSRELVTSFSSASDALDKLADKYPADFLKMDSFTFTQISEITRYVKSTSAYPDVRSVLKKNGFSQFEDFLDVSVRLVGGMYKVSMQKLSPQERQQMEAFEKSMQDNIKTMKQNGMSDSMISGMKAQMSEMQEARAEMKLAAKKVSPADIKFINENYGWLETFMSNDGAH